MKSRLWTKINYVFANDIGVLTVYDIRKTYVDTVCLRFQLGSFNHIKKSSFYKGFVFTKMTKHRHETSWCSIETWIISTFKPSFYNSFVFFLGDINMQYEYGRCTYKCVPNYELECNNHACIIVQCCFLKFWSRPCSLLWSMFLKWLA